MRFYILAGEASGDVHAAGLIRALRRHCPEAEFRGMGGDACRSEGMVLHRHFSEQNYMGFAEILRHLPQIFRNIRETVADIAAYQPQVVIPVDYPGFNFRVMRQVRAMGIPVDYFIPPQIWAWRPGRAKTLARYTRHRLVVFPFEPQFYKGYGVDVDFVGNPLVDELQGDLATELKHSGSLALLPGSRRLEVEHILPIMVQAALQQGLPAVVCGMRHLPDSVYAPARQAGIPLVYNQTRETLKGAAMAWVASGTATLETALLGVPQVVCYKASALSVGIARRLIRVPYISLVNLLLNRPVVTELIQRELSVERLLQASQHLQGAGKKQLAHDYAELRHRLGGSGCFDQAARRILGEL
jgi:lipid-A-disaccharide synthase